VKGFAPLGSVTLIFFVALNDNVESVLVTSHVLVLSL
jgi:hypothetical protein